MKTTLQLLWVLRKPLIALAIAMASSGGGPLPLPTGWGHNLSKFDGHSLVKAQDQKCTIEFYEEIPYVALPLGVRIMTLDFSSQSLFGKFTGMWNSPWSMDVWIDKTWNSMMKGNINLYSSGNDLFAFLLELKEEKYVIFGNKPYFFKSRGMYLNKWSLDLHLNE